MIKKVRRTIHAVNLTLMLFFLGPVIGVIVGGVVGGALSLIVIIILIIVAVLVLVYLLVIKKTPRGMLICITKIV